MREYDYEIRRGETFDECFYVVDPDDKPIDLTGMTAKGQIRRAREDQAVAAEFRCSIDIGTGCVTYELSASQTKLIPPGNYEYDVCLYEDVTIGAANERVVKYYIGGKFKVLKAVTNALHD